ncbi:MAG: hypothetical protein KF901_27985 [Myxococcales bacterium]|nr:hypothetical protein [Myxococcales bacterium]
MARFDRKSRYAHLTPTLGRDPLGREVAVLPTPIEPPAGTTPVARIRRGEGQRLDHLAAAYLRDPTGFWRLCEANDAMLPDALAEVDELDLPEPSR